MVPDKASALMDERSSGAGEFAVDFKERLLRAEADGRMMGCILGKTYCKLLVYLVFVPGTDAEFLVYFTAADAA